MRAAAEAEAGCWDGEGCGAGTGAKHEGQVSCGCLVELSRHFCHLFGSLEAITYLGKLIMTDPRRRLLVVLKLGRTAVLHNLHFVHLFTT